MAINYNFGTPQAAKPAITVSAHDLFVTRIWQARLTTLASHFADWVAAVEAMRAASPAPAGRTNRHGWNSESMAVFDLPAFADLREVITGLCTDALRQIHGAAPDFKLTSWINIHDEGGFNFAHMHDGCLLSGVFYLQVPPGSGPLVLRDPRPAVVLGEAKGGGPNAYTDVRLKPEAGLVVLFPAWLEHFVDVHGSDVSRISLAFNAVRP